MSRPTYAAVWRARFAPQAASCEEILRGDPFPDWPRNDSPERDAAMELTQGLRMFYAGEEDIARRFFERAVAVVARAEAEKPYQESEDLPFPRNRAALARTKVHAASLLGGMSLSEARLTLSSAAGDYELWCQGYRGSSWDAQAQAYYLNAVRLASLAEDAALVSRLLATRKNFKWHPEEREILGLLAAGERGAELAQRLLALFDRLRNPDFRSPVFLETELVSLELALLHDLVFGAGAPLDWLAAARRVGE
jgi:hypothetical protein